MKKLLFVALAAATVFGAQAQKAYYTPSFGDNWSIGVDGGVVTPLSRHHAFFGDMRGAFGLHIQKQVTPVVAIGVEGAAAVNTSSWNEVSIPGNNSGIRYSEIGRSGTAIDNLYVGVYTNVNLFNLFCGYKARFFDMDLTIGGGWGHDFYNDGAFYHPGSYVFEAKDQNYLQAKAGLNFNFNVCENLTISLKPSVAWNMTGTEYAPLNVYHSTAAYSRDKWSFNLMAGVQYNFGPGFVTADTKNQTEIDALNATLNGLRAELAACQATAAANMANIKNLQAELEACKNRKPEVIEKVSNNLSSVRYVFYRIGSSKITADQQPNVEMVASYLKNHKDSKVVVKGYASPDGNLEFNKKLAAARAESVKTMLVNKYGIASDRIQAEGCGIGDMFSENDWNRVSICTLED